MFTVLNMFSGFMSILTSTQGNFVLAAWFIILAASFDALDGIMARITKSTSEFGVELDSLSDIVSFGVAPSFLVYHLALFELQNIGILLSAFPMIFGGIRLARFNVQLVGFDKDFFRGLPIPSAAGLIVTFVLTFYDDVTGVTGVAANMLIPIVVISSLLMVSTIKYDTLPRPGRWILKEAPVKFGIILISLIAVILTKGSALFYVFCLYACSGPVRYIMTKTFTTYLKHPEATEESDDATSFDT
jgi:CDP-diacylglycerol---serine O-phosphatidyltransferase